MAMICFSKFSKWTRKAALITPEWLTTGETLLKTPIWMMLRSKLFLIFIYFHKRSQNFGKKRERLLLVCYYTNHINASTFLDLCALVIFSNFLKTLPGGERGEERGGGKIWVKSVKFCLYSTKTRCYSGVQQAHPMKSTENLDFNLQKARIFSSKARVTREDLKRYWTTDRGKFFNQNCLRLLSRRF